MGYMLWIMNGLTENAYIKMTAIHYVLPFGIDCRGFILGIGLVYENKIFKLFGIDHA